MRRRASIEAGYVRARPVVNSVLNAVPAIPSGPIADGARLSAPLEFDRKTRGDGFLIAAYSGAHVLPLRRARRARARGAGARDARAGRGAVARLGERAGGDVVGRSARGARAGASAPHGDTGWLSDVGGDEQLRCARLGQRAPRLSL